MLAFKIWYLTQAAVKNYVNIWWILANFRWILKVNIGEFSECWFCLVQHFDAAAAGCKERVRQAFTTITQLFDTGSEGNNASSLWDLRVNMTGWFKIDVFRSLLVLGTCKFARVVILYLRVGVVISFKMALSKIIFFFYVRRLLKIIL